MMYTWPHPSFDIPHTRTILGWRSIMCLPHSLDAHSYRFRPRQLLDCNCLVISDERPSPHGSAASKSFVESYAAVLYHKERWQ